MTAVAEAWIGVAVDSGKALYHTVDAGSTWSKISPSSVLLHEVAYRAQMPRGASDGRQVALLSAQSAVAVGENGTVVLLTALTGTGGLIGTAGGGRSASLCAASLICRWRFSGPQPRGSRCGGRCCR